MSQYSPTFAKGGHKERTVYHVRLWHFISPWCKHPIDKSTRFILVVIVLGIYNFGHQVFLSCLDKFNGDLPLVYDLTLGLCYQSVAAAPPVAHFHRQLNLIRVANTQLITLNLISCIMHRKLVKPLLGFILHDKALNYATALCFLYLWYSFCDLSNDIWNWNQIC